MKKYSAVLTAVAIVLISFCLRPPITGVGPLVTTLQADLGLSGSAAGLLTTLPLIAFAVVSFITGYITRKVGAGRTIFASLIILAFGLVCRSFLGIAGLFIGTVLIGVGIGINNVLLPAVIKARFPEKVGLMTSIYTTCMAGFASLATGISVPMALGFSKIAAAGWKYSLFIWIIPVVTAFAFWLPNINLTLGAPANTAKTVPVKRKSITRFPMTWFITVYMGVTSFIFYVMVAWFATVLQSHGYSQSLSGYLNMIMLLCGLPGSFLTPIILSKAKNPSILGAMTGILYTIGIVTLLLANNPVFLIITILTNGFGSGSAISFAMAMYGMRTGDAEDAASLSAFGQGVGNIMAAAGPFLMGRILDLTSSWTLPIIILALFGVCTAVFGWLSGQKKIVDTRIL